MNIYKGKSIEIHRQFNMLALAQNDPEVKEWYGQSFRAIGPYYEAGLRTVGTGLSFEEQKILMPALLGIEAEDKDFRRVVTNFYHEINTRVPKDGLKLQISLENDALPLSTNNMPINIKDYVIYKHLLGHPEVAPDEASAQRLYNKKFYIHDPDGVSTIAVSISDLEDKATVVYMKYKDDAIKLDQILTILGINIKGMKPEAKLLAFKEFSKINPKYNDFEQKGAFERFITIAEDRDLEYKYLIQEMIGAQYLKKVGTAIHLSESGEVIGQDMEAAVMYYKNPKNSRELNLLRAQYLTKVKKNESYLPKEPKANDLKVADSKTE